MAPLDSRYAQVGFILIPLLINSLAKWETPLSTVVRSTEMGYQMICLLRLVVHIYVVYPDFASTAKQIENNLYSLANHNVAISPIL